VTLTASVTGSGQPVGEGTVTFGEGATVLAGPLALDVFGHASFTTSTLPVGSHSVVAAFSGTGRFATSSGAVTQTVVPGLSIDDVSVTEGNGATAVASFTVTMTPAGTAPVTVQFATANGTAIAPADFVDRPLSTLTFAPGVTTQTVAVAVVGDRVGEPTENFFVNLSNASGAFIVDGQGVGTIVNDDALAPVIQQFSPTAAPIGATITITGANFERVSTVRFNGFPTLFRVNSPTEIMAIVPLVATDGPISVTSSAGTGTSRQDFHLAPRIAALLPDSGRPGTVVNIAGAGLGGTTAVTFGGVPAVPVFTSPLLVRVEVPRGAVTGAVAVVTPFGIGSSAGSLTPVFVVRR
jgi:hypothetical protein